MSETGTLLPAVQPQAQAQAETAQRSALNDEAIFETTTAHQTGICRVATMRAIGRRLPLVEVTASGSGRQERPVLMDLIQARAFAAALVEACAVAEAERSTALQIDLFGRK